jgi:transposase
MIANWHKGLFGKKIQHSILGRIKSKLKQSNQTMVLSRSFATTKTCSCCGQKVDMKLSDRVFRCEHCNIEMDRDIHAAQNMIHFYWNETKVPTEHRDVKPVEMETSAKLKNLFNNVSYISMKQEADVSLA